jgi:hypothetical protein
MGTFFYLVLPSVNGASTVVVDLVGIKIRRDTHIHMLKIQGYLQMSSGKSVSMADLVDRLLDDWPGATAMVDTNLFKIEKKK